MADGTEGAETTPRLNLNKGHPAGHTSVAWFKSEGTWHAVTAGADSRVVTRHPRNNQEIKNVEGQHGAWKCLMTSPDGSTVAGVDDQYVKVWSLPDLVAARVAVGRFVATPRCCCWDKDSTVVAAAGDDAYVQIVTAKDAKLKHKIKNEGFTRGLGLDPEGQYLAAANADGTVSVWDIKQDPVKLDLKKRLGPKVDHDDDTARQGLAWHPDGGTLLAVAGLDNDVVLLERLSWTPVSYLSGGHDGSVGVIAFSPNGVYAATAGTDNKVVVWSVDKAVQVAARQLSCMATSLSWHPQNNALLIAGSDGGVGLWNAPVPELGAGGHKMPSPWLPVDDLLKEADRAAADASKGHGVSYDDLEDDMDDDEVAHVVKRRGLMGRTEEGGPAASGGNGPTASDLLDQLDAAAEEAAAYTSGQGYGSSRFRPAATAGYNMSRPRPPQAPIHPGSTPAGSSGNARFLAYNQLGCVVSKAVEDHHTVEVTFHDTSRHRLRVPLLTDYFNFSAASMGTKGVAYISPSVGAEQPSMLVWRGFESWATGADWTAAMPEGEDAVVVAAGPTAIAVATSKRLLRIYSIAGRQLAVLSLPGTPVAVATPDPGHNLEGGVLEVACQHHLAVVYAEEGPNPLCGTQQLAYTVFDTARCSKAYSGNVVLSTGASLSWLAFSREGLLAAMDTSRVLRVRSPDWGGSWVPVLDAVGAKARAGAEQYWPTWLDTSTCMAVVTSSKVPHPQVTPRPLITSFPLALFTAPAETTPAEAEESALLAVLKASQIRTLTEAGSPELDEDLAACNEATQVEADKTALRLLTAYLKVGKQTRALELVPQLHQIKSVEGALRIANHFHMPRLAEHITAILEDKIQSEQEQEQFQQQAPHWTSLEVPYHQDSQGDVENVQPEQAHLQTKEQHTGSKSALGVNKGTISCQKRKAPNALDMGLAAEAKCNPFARRKVMK